MPRSHQQRQTRACTEAINRLISVYPKVHAHDPQAASELRIMFSAYAGKKHLRQIAGVARLAEKQQATRETRMARRKGKYAAPAQ